MRVYAPTRVVTTIAVMTLGFTKARLTDLPQPRRNYRTGFDRIGCDSSDDIHSACSFPVTTVFC